MERSYEQVRDDLKVYLEEKSIPQRVFAWESKLSESDVSRFITGKHIGENRKAYLQDKVCKVLYPEDTEEIIQEETVTEEETEEKDIESLDSTITKLIDKKIEETMKQIAELESKVKNLEASRDILKELLD